MFENWRHITAQKCVCLGLLLVCLYFVAEQARDISAARRDHRSYVLVSRLPEGSDPLASIEEATRGLVLYQGGIAMSLET